MKNSKLKSGNRRAVSVETLELRLMLTGWDIVVNSQNYSPLQLYSQSGTLLATSSNYPQESSAGAGDGGSAGPMVVDQNDNLQVFTGVFEPFLQRSNGQINASSGWTTEQTTIGVPGWSKVNRTFYGGLATIGNYVFTTDMATANAGAANGLIRFDASNGYAATRFASGTDYCSVTLGMDGNIYAMVSPGGEPESGTVNVYNPTTLALIRSIPLTDTDDAAVVADAQGNIYTGAFGGSTMKISPAGVVLATAPIASTDLQISSDGKILSCAGNQVRVLDENLNVLSGFDVSSPVGAVFACWNTYQAPGVTTTTGTAVVSTDGSTPFGQSVTFTATITPVFGTGETGTVQFMDGSTALGGPVALNSSTGTATYTTSALPAGSQSITAVYSGDSNFTGGTSPVITQTVAKATTTIAISDGGGVHSGSPFAATATVNGASTLEGIAPTVAYYSGTTATGTPLGSAPSAVGTYTAIATFPGSTDYASATSNAVTFDITAVPVAPSITTQPTGQSALENQQVTFTAAANGAPAPTVQWQFSIDGGMTYSEVVGATSATYSFTAMLSQTGYLYDAVFTNSQGSKTTSAAMLTVNVPPSMPMVTTDPTDQTVPTDQPVTFTAAAVGNPVPKIQWEVSNDGGTSYNEISGATSASYTFTTAAGQNGDMFRAQFVNSHGTADSAAATLTLTPPLTSPTVSTDPTDQTVLSGNMATFTAVVNGNPVPAFQWQSSTDGTDFSDISGATSATFSFTATMDQTGTSYRAVVTNSQGSATTTAATLSVTPTQFVESAPPPDAVPAGQDFGFVATVTDPSGNVDTGYTGYATVALSPGSSATLNGPVVVPVTNGVATFSDLTIDSVGSYSLVVSGANASRDAMPTVSVTTPLSDVDIAFTHAVFPPSAIIGGKLNGHFSVVLSNTGGEQKGGFAIRLYANTTNTLDGNEQLLATLTKNLFLRSGKVKSFGMSVKTLPQSLPAGTYYILAEVVDTANAINVAATTSTVVAAAPFVHLTATATAVTPADIAANSAGSIEVTIANSGNEAATGPLTITLTPSADGVTSMPVELSSISPMANIGPNKTKTYRLHFKSTGQLASGMYFPYITVSLAGDEVTAVGATEFTVE